MHRRGGRGTVATQDRFHHTIMLGIRFRQAPEVAELRPAERLHAHPRGDGHFRQIIVVRARIDDAVKRLVRLMMALRIADMDQRAKLFVRRLECARSAGCMRSAARPAHKASSSPIASNIPTNRSSSGRATTAPRCGRDSTNPLAASCRMASRTGVRETLNRSASSVSSSADPGARTPRTISSAICNRSSSASVLRPLSVTRRFAFRQRENAHDAFASGSSITLTCAATTRQPSSKRTQVCICRPIFPGDDARRNNVEAVAKSRP